MLSAQEKYGRLPRIGAARAAMPSLLALLGALSACTGTVVDNPGALSGAASPNGSAGQPPEDEGYGPLAPEGRTAFSPAPAALRKLTVRQYQNTARDLFGADAPIPSDLEPDTAINGFHAIGATKSTISPSSMEKFERAAFALAEHALAPAHRDGFVGCKPAGVTDTACTTAFLTRFGRRAFRRPLGSDELARYLRVAEAAQQTLADFHGGLQFAVAGLLQSPKFLFRRELGGADADAREVRAYDDYEMASRLSYLLWNSTPDDALLDAAERGELTVVAGLEAQAERLLSDPRAKAALDDFHGERLALEELDHLNKGGAVFGGVDDAFRAAMRRDVLSTIEELTFGDGADFRDLFTTRVVVVESKLASIYGLPSVSGSARMELPASAPRAGLLGKVAFLAANAHAETTSPTLRGKYIRERFLCQSIPAPPPNVVTVLPAVDPNAPTMRDRLLVHAQTPSCAGCHKLMDPLGLSLEHFDAIGRYRATDQGHALDTSGSLDDVRFGSAVELAQLLRDDPRTSECVARQVYRYAVGHVEGEGEEPAIRALIEAFQASGYRFTALLRAVVTSDGFRFSSRGE